MDLTPNKTDNCHVDNHAVLAVYFVLTKKRTIQYLIMILMFGMVLVGRLKKGLCFSQCIVETYSVVLYNP